ncbi:unnamed protein product [Closterium sp. NIES-53]
MVTVHDLSSVSPSSSFAVFLLLNYRSDPILSVSLPIPLPRVIPLLHHCTVSSPSPLRRSFQSDWISAVPDVYAAELADDAEFVIIASDGLWEGVKR